LSTPLTEPRYEADYLQNAKPSYPSLSRRLREQGTVLLRVLVSAGGEPKQIQLLKSSGYPRLDDAALRAVEDWRFVPAKRGHEPLEAWVQIPLQFSLRS
jgi:protein TonB